MKPLLIISILMLLTLFSLFAQEHNDSTSVTVSALQNENVSVIHILANPDKYHNEEVIVTGYLHYKFEDYAIYLSKEHADYLLNEYALSIRLGDSLTIEKLSDCKYVQIPKENIKQLNCKYVSIKGTFNKHKLGHLGAYHGSIENINHIYELRRWYDGDKELIGIDKATGNLVPKN